MTGAATAAAVQRQQQVREGAAWDQRVQVQEVKDASGKAATVFRDVTVLGLVSQNVGSNGKARTYTKEAVQAAIPLYEGARVFLDHTPAWELPSIDRLAGALSGVYWDEPTQMLRARELRIERTDRTAHALHLCEQRPGLVGLSHDVTVACPTEDDSQVVAIMGVRCVDLVPGGATTGGLYEQAGAGLTPAQIAAAIAAASAPAVGAAKQENTTMNEQEQAQLKAAETRAAAAEAKATSLQEQVTTSAKAATVATAMEQAADLPEPTRKNLRAVLEQTAALTPAIAQEIVKARRDELTALGLIGAKPAATTTQVVTGAGAGDGAPVQEQVTDAQVKAVRVQVREQAGRAAGLRGESLKAYTERE